MNLDNFTSIDGNLLVGIQHLLNADWLTPVMKAITLLGEDGYFLIAACILLMIIPKTRRLGIICSLSLCLTFICTNLILKPAFDRTRPWVLFEAVNAMLPPPGDASFPSGHTANSMGLAWALLINTRSSGGQTPCLGWKGKGADPAFMHRIGIVSVILAVLVGISRLYLGMHFPSDVVCGLLIGIITATIIHIVVKKIESSRGIIGEKSI